MTRFTTWEGLHQACAPGAFFDPTGSLQFGYGQANAGSSFVWADEVQGSYDGATWSLTLSFVSDAGSPAGTMVVQGTAEPAGDPLVLDERFRDGNAWVTVRGTVQPLLVDATVTEATGQVAPFAGVDLGCGGNEVDLVWGGTDPATRIFRFSGSTAGCDLGGEGFLGVDAFGDMAFGFVVIWPEGQDEPSLVADGELTVSGSSITGNLPVVEPPTDPLETVGVDLTVGSVVDRGTIRFKSRNSGSIERYTDRLLTGSVTLPDGTTYEVDCTYRSFEAKDRFSSKAGQKPGGKPPVNDLPGGALPLADGATVQMSTRGAAEAAEAACVEEFGPVPLGRTVWYAFTGTGADVTLSTVGSDFDTVIGVYDAGSSEQVACVDDTFDTGLQAAVTVPTVTGASYLVQVGGFGGDFGKLRLARS